MLGIIGIAGAGYIFHDVMQWSAKHYNWDPNATFQMAGLLAMGDFNCNTGLAPYNGSTTKVPARAHSRRSLRQRAKVARRPTVPPTHIMVISPKDSRAGSAKPPERIVTSTLWGRTGCSRDGEVDSPTRPPIVLYVDGGCTGYPRKTHRL